MLQKVSQTKLNRMKVAALIEDENNEFCMSNWCHCICGFAHEAMGENYKQRAEKAAHSIDQYIKEGVVYLGLKDFRPFMRCATGNINQDRTGNINQDRAWAARLLREYEEV